MAKGKHVVSEYEIEPEMNRGQNQPTLFENIREHVCQFFCCLRPTDSYRHYEAYFI